MTPLPTVWKLPSRRAVGMACLIATESALFSVFVIAYLFYLGKSLTGPFPADVLEMPVLATICLLSSSLTIVLAERGLHKGRMGQFKLWWLVTILLAAEFRGVIFGDEVAHFLLEGKIFGAEFHVHHESPIG